MPLARMGPRGKCRTLADSEAQHLFVHELDWTHNGQRISLPWPGEEQTEVG